MGGATFLSPCLGALALSPSHGEVGGRLFLCGGTPLPGAWEKSSTELCMDLRQADTIGLCPH